VTTSTSPQSDRTSEETSNQDRDALASLRIKRPDPRDSRKSRRKWPWIAGFVLLLGGGFFGYRCSVGNGWVAKNVLGRSTWVPEIMQNPVEVRLASVAVQKGRSADAVVVATGYLKSRRQARIGARASGLINIISFEEGDRVSQGEVLAELEHKDFDASLTAVAASVARAKAALAEQEIVIEQAEVNKNHFEELWKSQDIAEKEVEQARFTYRATVARKKSMEAEIELAEAEKRRTEQLRENMFIRAPFDGTVISKDAEVGESISPGGMGGGSGRGSIATIADLEHLQIECDVQEDSISRVTEGQEAEIAVDAVKEKKYHGKVWKIIPMGDRARATIKVRSLSTTRISFCFRR